ncbi:MAG: hypothetical protein US40_C0002G0003 [Candidatus Roizmanbacteria bacterium GW2011_GWC2_37_13]|uniref:Sortase family protein n=1 Tax=Candidatus Roizmanbacteria bacterium GW2011_GWC2_37_13 TaxID=1618486 RepID=A0A0G0IQK6_9BACT|nr:MAG: hypothetical protein US38_C0006G0003 [Candidatus Roizmanbacteria bacterium GW2011_GWC1_37_12]KKQ26469.1 MAG: hypothetical protein US40_C0002G0003 [Candidatus Roizmanbacteria bacterium GW2011_GWC2_37_13]
MASTTSSKKGSKLSKIFLRIGFTLFLTGLALFFFSFYRVLWQETKYNLTNLTNRTNLTNKPIKPIDEEFGIVIPKINANAKVISNVDPYDSKDYQYALTKGVAHAKGTAFPGHAGNTFIFAHSSVDWYIANRYNSVFYLLNKLEKGDKIEMYYKKKKYVYEVSEKKMVEASDVSHLDPLTKSGSVLTLMTCWPPGTTLKRLIIQAKIKTLDK